MNPKVLKAAGVGPEEMALHLAFLQEFIWNRLVTRDDGRVVTIMDAEGLSLSKCTSSDLAAIVRATSEVSRKE